MYSNSSFVIRSKPLRPLPASSCSFLLYLLSLWHFSLLVNCYFPGNFVLGQNNSKYCDWAHLRCVWSGNRSLRSWQKAMSDPYDYRSVSYDSYTVAVSYRGLKTQDFLSSGCANDRWDSWPLVFMRRHAPLVASFMIDRKDNRRNNWNKGQEPWNNRGACY